MQTHLLALINLASVGQQVLAAAFLTSADRSPLCPTLISRVTYSIDWSPLLPSADFVILLTDHSCRLISGTFILSSLRFRGRSHVQALCVGFAPKQKKGFTDWHPHPRKQMPPIVSYKQGLSSNKPSLTNYICIQINCQRTVCG